MSKVAILQLREDLADAERLAETYRAALHILEGTNTPANGVAGLAGHRQRKHGFTASVLRVVSQSPCPITREAIASALTAQGVADQTGNMSGHLSKALRRLVEDQKKIALSTDPEGRRLYSTANTSKS